MNAVLISSAPATQAGLNIQPTKELLQALTEIEQPTGFLCSCTLLFNRVWLISVTLLQSKQTSCRQERQMSCNQRRPQPRAQKERAELCVCSSARSPQSVDSGMFRQSKSDWFPKLSPSTLGVCAQHLLSGGKRAMGGGCTRLHCSQGSPLIYTIWLSWQCSVCVSSSQSDNLP